MGDQFSPYSTYKQNVKQIEDFVELTGLSYGLTQQLLFKYPKESIPKIPLLKPKFNELSFCMADQEVASIELVAGWLGFSEYAEKVNLQVEEVQRAALDGELGQIQRHPESGKELVLWPPKLHESVARNIPEIGKRKYRITLEVRASAGKELDPTNLEAFEATQHQFLLLAHSIGAPSEASDRAEEMLYRSGLLLQWTAFEVFLKSTIHELMRLHPSKIAVGDKGKKKTITYQDIVKMTEDFSSIDKFRENLVEREIEQQQGAGESIHGLINFLKSEFRFEKDPYDAWYVIDGERKTVTYNGLIEIKEIRNTLVHDAGRASISFKETYPTVHLRDGYIALSEHSYVRFTFMLRSVAYSIATSSQEC